MDGSESNCNFFCLNSIIQSSPPTRRGKYGILPAVDNPKDILLLVNAPTSDPFYGVLLECARKYGWRLTIEERMSAPEDWRGDGAIVYSVDYPAVARGIRSLVRRGIPVVDLAWSKTTRLASRCVFDIGKAGKLAATHFRSLGFERAAFFSMESVFIRSVTRA